jgi:hypothetical protein
VAPSNQPNEEPNEVPGREPAEQLTNGEMEEPTLEVHPFASEFPVEEKPLSPFEQEVLAGLVNCWACDSRPLLYKTGVRYAVVCPSDDCFYSYDGDPPAYLSISNAVRAWNLMNGVEEKDGKSLLRRHLDNILGRFKAIYKQKLNELKEKKNGPTDNT